MESDISRSGNNTKDIRTSKPKLTSQQTLAIKLAVATGDRIRQEYPHFAEEYRAGLTAPSLVQKYGLAARYGIGSRIAIQAVRMAIRGYSGYFHGSYKGLIPGPSERAKLALAHNRQTGTEVFQEKKGIHALTSKQRAAASRKGGLISGPLSYRLRFGCHALPPEVLRDLCRRNAPIGGKAGARAATLGRGMVPYVPATAGRPSEADFAFQLATNSIYLGPLRSNFKKIAEEVNKAFNRQSPYTRTTLKIALKRYRRQLCTTVVPWNDDSEMSFAEALSSDPAYQIAPRIKARQIASKVNDEYHNGQPVRNAVGIRAAIQRYSRQVSKTS